MSKPSSSERDNTVVDVGHSQVQSETVQQPPKPDVDSVSAPAVVTAPHTVAPANPPPPTEQHAQAQAQPQHVTEPAFQVARETVTVAEQVPDHEAEAAAAAAAALEVTAGMTTPELGAHSQTIDTVAAAAMVAVSTPTGTVSTTTYAGVHPSAAQISTSHLTPQMIAPNNSSVGHAAMRVPIHAGSLPPVSPITKAKPSPPFVCEVVGCGKTFGKKFNLKAHRRVHTGEEPFVCSYPTCGKRFKWKSSLTFHEGLHLNVVDDPQPPPPVDPNVAAAAATATAVTVTVNPEQDKTAKTEAGKVQ